jgi:hypothetical protein
MAEEGPYLLAAAFFAAGTVEELQLSLAAMKFSVTLVADADDPGAPLVTDLVFVLFVAAAEKHPSVHARAVLRSPSGSTEEILADDLSFEAGMVATAMAQSPLIAPEIGRYWCLVSLDGREVTRVPLNVQIGEARTRTGDLPM